MTNILRELAGATFRQAGNWGLRVTVWTILSLLNLELRYATKNSSGRQTIFTGTAIDPSGTAYDVRIEDIPVTVQIAAQTADVVRGQVFVRVELTWAGVPIATLINDYVYEQYSPVYPPIAAKEPTPDTYRQIRVVSADPAAGTLSVSLTFSSLIQVRVLSAAVTLTTDATVASRYVYFYMQYPAGNQDVICYSTATQPENTTYSYFAAPQGAAYANGAGDRFQIPIPYTWLPGGSQIGFVNRGGQAGDDFGAMVVIYEYRVTQ